MEVINIYPKELHIKIEFTETELNYLLDYLDRSVADLDLNDDYQAKCSDFVTKDFFPKMEVVSEEMKRMK